MLGTAGAVAAGTAVVGGAALAGLSLGGYWTFVFAVRIRKAVKDRRLIARIPTNEGEMLTVLGRHVRESRISTDVGGEEGWKLELTHTGGSYALRGRHALHATSLIMPKVNGTGGSRQLVERAMERLEAFDHPEQYMRSAAAFSSHASRAGDSLSKLPVDVRLAMEMAANEESERFALEGEMALLEMAWEEAEEIAAIADNLTLPHDVERQLEELHRARNRDNSQP